MCCLYCIENYWIVLEGPGLYMVLIFLIHLGYSRLNHADVSLILFDFSFSRWFCIQVIPDLTLTVQYSLDLYALGNQSTRFMDLKG